jgi:hypothetical protein
MNLPAYLHEKLINQGGGNENEFGEKEKKAFIENLSAFIEEVPENERAFLENLRGFLEQTQETDKRTVIVEIWALLQQIPQTEEKAFLKQLKAFLDELPALIEQQPQTEEKAFLENLKGFLEELQEYTEKEFIEQTQEESKFLGEVPGIEGTYIETPASQGKLKVILYGLMRNYEPTDNGFIRPTGKCYVDCLWKNISGNPVKKLKVKLVFRNETGEEVKVENLSGEYEMNSPYICEPYPDYIAFLGWWWGLGDIRELELLKIKTYEISVTELII